MGFKLEIRLNRLAGIALATSLVKDSSVHSFLKIYDDLPDWYIADFINRLRNNRNNTLITELFKDIVKVLEYIKLPKNVFDEIVLVIEPLLVNCIKWHIMIRKKLNFDYVGLGKLYWTCYGTIDTARIVKKEWASWFDANGALKENVINHLKLPFEDKVLHLRFAMYYMACSCILKSYIESHSCDIIQFCEQHYAIFPRQIEYILYSVYFLNNSKAQILERYQKKDRPVYEIVLENLNSWEKESTIPMQMFLLSVRQTSGIGARYYWELLSSDEKDSCIIPEATYCYSQHNVIPFLDVAGFLVSQMSENQMKEYFLSPEMINNRNFPITSYMDWFSDNWPWDELFFSVFKIIKLCITKTEVSTILSNITENIICMNQTIGYEFKNATYYLMFYTVFEEIRRRTANGEGHLIPKYTDGDEFIELFDFKILKLISELECQDEESRKKFVEPDYGNSFGELVRENRFDEMDKFTEVVLTSDGERKWFKKYFKWHPDFVQNGDFEALDNLLNWQCDSEEERKNCKHEAIVHGDLVDICGALFLKNQMDQAEKAKKWAISDDQDRQAYVNDFNTSESSWLVSIWEKCLLECVNYEDGIEEAKRKTYEFLKWFLETDETVTKFTEKLTDKKFIMSFLQMTRFLKDREYYKKLTDKKFITNVPSGEEFKKLSEMDCCKILDGLLNFNLSADGVTRFKDNIYCNIQEWLQRLCKSMNFFLIWELNNFLDYVTDDPSKKEKAIKIFLHSESRREFFSRLFAFEDFKKCDKWLCSWMKVGIDQNEIENYVNDVSLNFRNREIVRSRLNDLLRTQENSGD